MKLPDLYNYGTLFAYSGLAGDNDHGADDFVAITMPQPISLRFDAADPVTLHLPVDSARMDFVLSDILQCRQALAVFADKETVIGRSAVQPKLFAQTAKAETEKDLQLLCANGFCYALLWRNGRFALCRAKTAADATEKARASLQRDPYKLRDQILAYYEEKPRCRDAKYEKLYYKCLSVNRVNVYSPQNGFTCRYTTPDRLPHKHMWLWDSMFHAITFAQYDPQMAKESILAVLQAQKEDGFLPHMMKSPTVTSAITQPQVVAWAVLAVYQATKDKDYLSFCADKIAAFETWFLKNRDRNGNGLLEWKTDYSNVRCRCDESGMDNSPRFDTTETLDAIDASCFMVHDCRCLSEIYRILGNEPEAAHFQQIADDMAQKINELLWDDTIGAYCDRTLSGELTHVLSVCSFLPLFAGVCTPERAAALVGHLHNDATFATPLPVASISRNHPDYGADMWRGCVWLNFNYFTILGLRQYGFADEAAALQSRTLQCVDRWFRETGNVFEFYDAEDQTAPWHLNRKGPQPPVPDYRIRYHAITDFNWSACFTLLMIQNAFPGGPYDANR